MARILARRRFLLAAVPAVVLAAVAFGAAGFVTLLASPETIMRTALQSTQPASSTTQAQQPVADHVLVRKVLASMAADADYGERAFHPLTMVGPVGIGDRISITNPDGRLRSLEVVEVRALDPELTKVAGGEEAGELLLIVSKVVGEADAAKVRFIVEARPVVPFDAASDLVARSL